MWRQSTEGWAVTSSRLAAAEADLRALVETVAALRAEGEEYVVMRGTVGEVEVPIIWFAVLSGIKPGDRVTVRKVEK
jgi:hypothetical protein